MGLPVARRRRAVRRALKRLVGFVGRRDPLVAQSPELSLESPVRSVARCRVCGFAEVRTDEVVDRGTLLLAECPRCEHRWTHGPTAGPPLVPAGPPLVPAGPPLVPAGAMRRIRSPHFGDEEPAAAA
jgi:hypothetical protein